MEPLYSLTDTPQSAPLSVAPCVATVGVFDGVHLGHRALLAQMIGHARRSDLRSVVFTFTEPPVALLKGKKNYSLLSTQAEQRTLLASCGVDAVVWLKFTPQLSRLTAREFMAILAHEYGVKVLFVGYDHRFGHDPDVGIADYRCYGAELGMEVIRTPQLFDARGIGISSSRIRLLLSEGQVALAGELLGTPYSFTGQVVDGQKLGRTLGYPTANIALQNPHKLLPPAGVYAATARVNDAPPRAGMLYIGTRPTLEGADLMPNPCSVELHLFDFRGNLYGSTLQVALHREMRPEQKFPDLTSLKQALDADARHVRRYFGLPIPPQS